ncbi:hypothetical protein BOX15_Mlig032410g1, partial [Macrostomum lignano]
SNARKQAVKTVSMQGMLRTLLRPAAYAATAVAAVAVAATSVPERRQSRQEHPIQNGLMRLRELRVAAPMLAAATTKPAHGHLEERFLEFASVEFNDTAYMTPEDFLESVTQDRPRFRRGRKLLSDADVEQMLRKAPSHRRASKKLMRSLGHDGIVSYSEYLFLLCTLANAESGFSIAFNMIDRSRNQSVEKDEFDILNTMVSECQAEQQQDTTLMRHFFGQSGKDSLDYNRFVEFMSNLQYEVLELEFLEFSKGLPSIPESEFARVLLRYTNLSPSTQAVWVDQVRDKLVREEGIGFEDFRQFFQFLNSLADFSMALQMYALAGHPVTLDEFQRAVKACVGYTLSPRVVSTVFLLLDKDGDGSLSSEELLAILKGRLKRLSLKSSLTGGELTEFRRCLKREIQRD